MLLTYTAEIYLIIISLCFTFAEPFDDIFLFVKSSYALVSGNTNKSLRPSEWIRARSLLLLENSRKNCAQKKAFDWQNTKVKALRVSLSTDRDPEITIKLNFAEKIEKMRNCLGCWTVRRLSLIGKIAFLKSLASSQVIHLLSSLQVNSHIIKQINGLFLDFNRETLSPKTMATEDLEWSTLLLLVKLFSLCG